MNKTHPAFSVFNTFKAALLIMGLSFGSFSTAYADINAENYVAENGQLVLGYLNDVTLSLSERTAKFNEFMDEFADINAISNFVIGKYARRLPEDKLAEYRHVFRAYALAVYQFELDQYRGESINVVNSIDRRPGDSIVRTSINKASGTATHVEWRVIRRGNDYQVVDVALDFDGNLIWLAIEQREQFIDILDRSNGNADALIDKISSMTAKLQKTHMTAKNNAN